MGEKVDLMNEGNREQTGGKRRVYGEHGAHSGCIIGTRTHRYHFPHSSGAAATLASLDMQSGPISSSVCRKWHVPPEEAQKQRQCPQPAINHAFVSHCVCSFGHTWIMGSLVINSPPQKNSFETTWNGICSPLQENINRCIHCTVFSPIYCCEIDWKHKTNSCSEVRAAFDSNHFEVSDCFLQVESLAAHQHHQIQQQEDTMLSLLQRTQTCFLLHGAFHMQIIEDWRFKMHLQWVEIQLHTRFRPVYWFHTDTKKPLSRNHHWSVSVNIVPQIFVLKS